MPDARSRAATGRHQAKDAAPPDAPSHGAIGAKSTDESGLMAHAMHSPLHKRPRHPSTMPEPIHRRTSKPTTRARSGWRRPVEAAGPAERRARRAPRLPADSPVAKIVLCACWRRAQPPQRLAARSGAREGSRRAFYRLTKARDRRTLRSSAHSPNGYRLIGARRSSGRYRPRLPGVPTRSWPRPAC